MQAQGFWYQGKRYRTQRTTPSALPLFPETLLLFNALMKVGPSCRAPEQAKRRSVDPVAGSNFHMHVAWAFGHIPPHTWLRVQGAGPGACSMTPMTYELGPGAPPEIGEEQLVESQPRVRALLVQRYEEIWNRVAVRIHDDQEQQRPIDPRILEIGLRVLKDEAVLYRLGRSMPAPEDEEDPTITAIDRAAMVAEQLSVLEAKQQAADASAKARHQHQEARLQEQAPAA